jgi:hypothetical protein
MLPAGLLVGPERLDQVPVRGDVLEGLEGLVLAALEVALLDVVDRCCAGVVAEGGLQVGVVVGTDEKLMQASATWRLKVKTRR